MLRHRATTRPSSSLHLAVIIQHSRLFVSSQVTLSLPVPAAMLAFASVTLSVPVSIPLSLSLSVSIPPICTCVFIPPGLPVPHPLVVMNRQDLLVFRPIPTPSSRLRPSSRLLHLVTVLFTPRTLFPFNPFFTFSLSRVTTIFSVISHILLGTWVSESFI